MIISIDDNRTIGDLQEKFNESFPLLKIEFYTRPHHWKASSLQTELINPSEKIGTVRKRHEHGFLEIKSWYQTGRVEQDFKRLFGLNVQIFRREKDKWHQTVSSDHLTLKDQQILAS